MEKKRHGFTKFFVIVGALLAVVAIVLFICGMSAADWDFRKLNTVNYIYMRYEQGNESISSVNIRYESADITVKVSDQADKISVQYPVRANPNDEPIATVRAEAVNGTLYIAESEQNWEWFSWNFSSPAVTVIIPADAALDSLTLSTDYGSLPFPFGKPECGNGQRKHSGIIRDRRGQCDPERGQRQHQSFRRDRIENFR